MIRHHHGSGDPQAGRTFLRRNFDEEHPAATGRSSASCGRRDLVDVESRPNTPSGAPDATHLAGDCFYPEAKVKPAHNRVLRVDVRLDNRRASDPTATVVNSTNRA